MTSNTNKPEGLDMTDELINLLREIRPSFSDVGSRDVDTRRKQNQIDRAIELLSASKPAAPQGFAVKRIEGHGWIIDPPSGSRWVAYEGTPAGELIQALAASPAAPSADAQDDERATLNFTEINDLMRTMQHQPYGIGSRVKDAVTFADAVQRAALARAASPQATVYSLFSSSDRRNFGHLTPQEFVNAVIEAVRAQATATQDTTDYEALEREHLGDADKGTGIYAQTERAAAERAAKALEKSRCQIFEWSDDEFEIWWSKDDRCQRERLVGEALFILRAASLQATARLTDEAILAALRPQLTEADGGYVCDLAQERVIAAGRDLLKAAQLNVGCPDGAKIAAGLGKQIEKPTAKSTPTTAMERTSFETYFHNKGVDPDLGGLEAFREKNAAWDAWEARARLAARPASGGDL